MGGGGGRGNPSEGFRTMKKSEINAIMRADSASHLLRQPVAFELFLFFYLVCTLLLQETNVYKTVSGCNGPIVGGRYMEILAVALLYAKSYPYTSKVYSH